MEKRLYCGNLAFSVDDDQLRELFAQYGDVKSANVISDRESGRSKGFGFVEFAGEDEAKAAIEALHEFEFEGRRLTVNEARPREERPRRSSGGGGRGGGRGSYDGGASRGGYGQ